MNTTIRNIIAVVLGIVIGGMANMFIIEMGPTLIPLPDGVDTTTPEGLKAAVPLLENKHYIVPLLAHALGTFIGALIAVLVAASHKARLAFFVGMFFLIGGITMVFMVPAPTWFIIVDLLLAYLPMAWIAGKLASRKA